MNKRNVDFFKALKSLMEEHEVEMFLTHKLKGGDYNYQIDFLFLAECSNSKDDSITVEAFDEFYITANTIEDVYQTDENQKATAQESSH